MQHRIVHLRTSAEIRLVYERGRRFDSSLMTVFVLDNQSRDHRLGITASRKMAKKAVMRNRAKRLLRETFRLSSQELCGLDKKYDWVINARRSLLIVKVAAPLKEFRSIIAQINENEQRDAAEASN